MNVIYKYELRPFTVTTLQLPVGSVVRHIGMQNEQICMWIEHDLSQSVMSYSFATIPTGNPIHEEQTYLGTAVGKFFGSPCVMHVYALPEEAQ